MELNERLAVDPKPYVRERGRSSRKAASALVARITGRRSLSRRRCYSLTALWLFLTVMSALQLATAEGSVGRWLAGRACAWYDLAGDES